MMVKSCCERPLLSPPLIFFFDASTSLFVLSVNLLDHAPYHQMAEFKRSAPSGASTPAAAPAAATTTSSDSTTTSPSPASSTVAVAATVVKKDFEGDLKKLQGQLTESNAAQAVAEEKFTGGQHALLEEFERRARVCPLPVAAFLHHVMCSIYQWVQSSIGCYQTV